MQSHEVNYEILGDDMQIVEIELDPGETVVAEAGAMNYMHDGITFEAKMGDGSVPSEGIMGKLLSAGKRVLTGESIFIKHFTNSGSGKKRVSFAAPYPGQIITIDMQKHRGTLLCHKRMPSSVRPKVQKSVSRSPGGSAPDSSVVRVSSSRNSKAMEWRSYTQAEQAT